MPSRLRLAPDGSLYVVEADGHIWKVLGDELKAAPSYGRPGWTKGGGRAPSEAEVLATGGTVAGAGD